MPAGPVKSVHGAFAIPSLDGIRAIAVMVVFIGHGTFVGEWWPADLGVTIFFFLSGYLITTLLRREYDRTRRISLGKFYLRRTLRILPPAYITIALCALVGAVGLLPSTMNGWGIAAEVLNVTNYYIVWADAATGSPHTGLPPESSMLWSLAVEEHFYLVFPAFMILMLWRRLSYRRIGWILVAACLAAPVWRLALAFADAGFYRLYVSTDTRFDGLLAGAAMALLANPALGDRVPFITRRWFPAATALAAVTVAVVSLLPQAIGLTIGDSVIYACLVLVFWFIITRPDGAVGRFLNSRIVAHIGLLSFSIYLLHRLVLALTQLWVEIPLAVDVISLIVTLLAAQLMYIAVEKPLGRVRKNLEGRMTTRGGKTDAARETAGHGSGSKA